ncbi:MAG: hypothetical protein QOH51_834 [Acidobacteriota bacterium]|jgi:hypothetical protein|nr:hypothetical protein [Acidobacteriota bacterium]
MATSYKERFEQILIGCFGSALFWGVLTLVVSVLTWLTAQSAYFNGIPLYIAIPAGAAVFFIFAFALYLISVAVARFRKPNNTNETASNTEPTNVIDECSDRWLHELADNDRRFIDNFVTLLTCEIGRHDLVHELYVEFKFTILNASVYAVEINDDVKGDVYLNTRLLSKDLKMAKDSIRYFRHGESGSFMIRQWLSSEEVKDFLGGSNKAGQFRLTGLEVVIKGQSPNSNLIPKNVQVYGLSVSGQSLWDLYQEIGIEIEQATFTAYWDFPVSGATPELRGLLINMHVLVINPRPVQLTIRSFRLTVKIKGKDYAADAEAGAVLYEDRIIKEGGEILRGQKFGNLNPPLNRTLTIEARKECGGQLQFILQGTSLEAIQKPLLEDFSRMSLEDVKFSLPATLVISNASGETHRSEEYQLSYVISYKS